MARSRNQADTGRHRRGALVRTILCIALMLTLPPATADAEQHAADTVSLLEIAGPIGPATSDYVQRGMRRALERGDRLVILKLDTPGGLDSAMREIIRAIIASPVPVASYVAPSGARAASAGTYILYASHVAAMAPATNLGAATPVQIGGLPSLPEPHPEKPVDGAPDGTVDGADDAPSGNDDPMTKKLINDAVAYIQGLARLRDRNEAWAEKAVREAASLTAQDALAANVIDIVADNEQLLLEQLDGRQVTVNGKSMTLETKNANIDVFERGWRTELLAIVANPNVAYVLMLLGIYGLFFELANPGSVAPGVIGAICLLVAMFALQMLPVNYAGLALVLLGISFMIGEVFVPSFGTLGIGGVIAFAIGSVILFDTESPQFRVSLSIIAALTILTAGFFLIAVRSLVAARKGPVVTGREQLVGSFGHALDDIAERGQIRIHGEIWNADTSGPLRRGARVKVIAMDGLTLHVEPLEEKEP